MQPKKSSFFPLKNDEFKELKPQLIKQAEGNSVRCRLIQIEHESQPGTKDKNAIHVELFDMLKIGRLNRSDADDLILGDSEEIEYESGVFLCGRSAKAIKVYHADNSRTWPSCKKCAEIAHRLIDKNLKMHLLSKDHWNKLQKIQTDLYVLRAARSLERANSVNPLTSSEVIEKCHELNLSLNFGDKWVEIIDQKNNRSIKGKTLVETYKRYLDTLN